MLTFFGLIAGIAVILMKWHNQLGWEDVSWNMVWILPLVGICLDLVVMVIYKRIRRPGKY